jgi:hypothetical protein
MTSTDPEAQAPPPAGLAGLRRELARLTGRHRLDLVLSQPDPGAVVRALPADELYLAIQEIGLADAAELVQLASPEQFRTFLDLDAWRGASLDPERLLPWLRAARAGGRNGEAEERRWRAQLAAIDSELLALLLRSTLRIHDLEEDPDPDVEGDRCLRTPEGRFLVELLPEGVDYVATRDLLDDLYAANPFGAGRLISAVRWDLPSDLEESALRWRSGRLADLGFPSAEEALSWFARPPREAAVAAPGEPARPPGFWLAAHRRGTLLDRAAARLDAPGQDRFELQAMAAANAVMVADQVEATDPEAVRSAVEAARALLELGLERLSSGDEAAAARVLATAPAKRIFQHGFARLLELRWRAQRLWEAGGAGTRRAPLLDPPLAEAAVAADRRRPLYFPGLETPRGEWGSAASGAATARAFRSPEEVLRTDAALADAEALAALARRLGLVPPPGRESRTTLSALYLTALANERLGRSFSADPIAAAEIPAAARAVEPLDDPRLASGGPGGELLAAMARNRSAELAPLRAGRAPPPGAETVLLQREDAARP